MCIRLLLSLSCAVLVGCSAGDSGEPPPDAARTQAERDSILAGSQLPGAGAVGRALETSAEARARAARLDSIQP